MDDFVTIATYLSLADVEPSRLALESAGIPAIATDESMGSLFGTTLVGGIKLQVAAADAARANAVLAALQGESQAEAADAGDADDGIALRCPACGAEIWYPSDRRGTAEICPECGSPVNMPE